MEITGIEALRRAKEILGSEGAIAAVCGVKQPSVNYILNGGKKVPAEWCIPLERAIAALAKRDGTNESITRYQLRPDLYPIEESEAAE